MHVTIDLSDQPATSLEAKGMQARMPKETYLEIIAERAPQDDAARNDVDRTVAAKSAYGLLAKYWPRPTREEIDENRRKMFSGFGEFGS